MTRHCARQHNAFRRVQILFLNEQEKAGVIEKETSTLAANLNILLRVSLAGVWLHC